MDQVDHIALAIKVLGLGLVVWIGGCSALLMGAFQ